MAIEKSKKKIVSARLRELALTLNKWINVFEYEYMKLTVTSIWGSTVVAHLLLQEIPRSVIGVFPFEYVHIC